MAEDAPIACPNCDLFADTGGTFLPKMLARASASTLSPTFVEVACAFTASISLGFNPAFIMVSCIHLCTVFSLGETKWLASEVIDQPANSIFGLRPCAFSKSCLAKIHHPTPSENQKPLLFMAKGRLVF